MTALVFNYEAQLTSCARGNQEALQAIYQHEAPRMLALCLKMFPERAIAEEILRESFVLIWKHAESYDRRLGPARAWMYSILRYRAMTRRRRSAATLPSSDGAQAVSLPESERQGKPSLILDGLATLSPEQQQVILQAYYRGNTYAEIAASLRAPAHRLRADAQKALDQLRERCQA
ncbi:MAG: sigma-70 family RNA polymerase sigma factor [Candidimonas sp.]|jgi:RNA polymerase sigma factor (sigma-70 family)